MHALGMWLARDKLALVGSEIYMKARFNGVYRKFAARTD